MPRLRVCQEAPKDRDVRKKHKMEKEKQKAYADEKRKAKRKVVRQGDQVMVQHKKSTI